MAFWKKKQEPTLTEQTVSAVDRLPARWKN